MLAEWASGIRRAVSDARKRIGMGVLAKCLPKELMIFIFRLMQPRCSLSLFTLVSLDFAEQIVGGQVYDISVRPYGRSRLNRFLIA